jgi:hypothetical protein
VFATRLDPQARSLRDLFASITGPISFRRHAVSIWRLADVALLTYALPAALRHAEPEPRDAQPEPRDAGPAPAVLRPAGDVQPAARTHRAPALSGKTDAKPRVLRKRPLLGFPLLAINLGCGSARVRDSARPRWKRTNRVTVLDRYRNYLTRTSMLGGEGRLRGYPTNYFVGKDLLAVNLEYRTLPVELFSSQFGGALFYDVVLEVGYLALFMIVPSARLAQ